ncbi:hypothetical protein PHLGIDRAFT_413431 [Phlebiopsis gigantea 11061_1 CR5-6]|uniref:Heterokaryon incompatibility domain-containing protein n=1 Tax=Phlebiopsis gigantea (strain 11061_1 CR5-6) TaxID=745531 RepID=A0A0C3S8P9_PHLG1|nr:hypothetical protein PHLGIDRAFT_413431 [Phlebiopsis gigantea 11061_1 CR5-6]
MSLKSLKLNNRFGGRDSSKAPEDKEATTNLPSLVSDDASPVATSPDLSSPSEAFEQPGRSRSLLGRTASLVKSKLPSSSSLSPSSLRDAPIDENEALTQSPEGSPDLSASPSPKTRPPPKPLGKLSHIASSISLPSPKMSLNLSRSNSSLLPLSKSGAGDDGRSSLASIDPFGLIETAFGNAKSGPFGSVKDFKSYVTSMDRIPGLRRLGRASSRANEVKKDVVAQAVERRKQLFKMVVVLSNGLALPDSILKSMRTERGISFVIKPPHRSSIPLQWVHRGPGAIDDALADTPCSGLGVDGLLAKLNEVLGTTYSLDDEHDLRICLEHFANPRENFDFGRAYGMLRPAWSGKFTGPGLLKSWADLQERDESMRAGAIEGDTIVTPRIPPRRVWDLRSNRVLPFWAIADPDPDSSDLQPESESVSGRRSNIPGKLWTVSHAWVHESDRHFVPTAINDFEWPAPIPRDTTLEHIRVELLNLGGDYIWLDVLCLRQQIPRKQSKFSTVELLPLTKHQRRGLDAIRLEEWKLDVPTIGHVYQHDRYQTVITYFNGLGRPFVIGPSILRSSLHWINRAWTLQETTPTWLPGGMTIVLFDDSNRGEQVRPGFFEQVQRLCAVVALNPPDIFTVVRAVQDRSSSNPVDRVGAVAYLLKLNTMPAYEPAADVEHVWPRLVYCLSDKHRTDLLMLYPLRGDNNNCRWAPSWYQLMQLEPPKAPRIPYSSWEYVRPTKDADGAVVYYHEAHVLKNCKLHLSGRSVGVLEVPEEENTNPNAQDVQINDTAIEPKPVGLGEGLPTHVEGESTELTEEPADLYEHDTFDGYVSDHSVDADDTATLVDEEEDLYDSDDSERSVVPPKTRRFKITTDHTQPIGMGKYVLVGVASLKYWIIGSCIEESVEGSQKVFKVNKISVIRIHNPNRRDLQKSKLGFPRAKVVYL